MTAVAPPVLANPFLALRSFRREDAPSFFGRDADLILVQSRLFSSRCTLLFAASGVGKSSFLDAKLAPALESQWQIVTHRSWASAAPLPGLLAAIDATAPATGEAGDLIDRVRRLLAAPGRARGCLVVLDQFEEVFQHWRDSRALDDFAGEVARLVHEPGLEARVLISMREEFVGELSLFDNLIPDLFNNCYRLKNATRSEAEEIITRTARLRGVDCGDGIDPLLDDLVRSASRIAAARVSLSGAQSEESPRSRIPMPFLQIVCYRLWRQQMAATTSRRFLERAPGPVRNELEAYCREKLQALSVAEQDLASAAFAFLMTRSGAKMAYPVDVLAQQAHVDERALLAVLEKLSDENVRILRKVPGHDAKPWFELYHDLYARFLSDWKRERDAARESKENWKWRLVVVALLVVSAATVAGLAIWRASVERAQLVANQAAEKNRALASRLALVSGLTPESREFTSRGVRYAAEAFARMPTSSSRATLLKALEAPVVETDRVSLTNVDLAAISPDGRFLAWAAPDGVMLKGLPGNTAIGVIDRPALVSAIAFSPDSATLAIAAWDGKVDVVSPAPAVKVLTSIDVIKGGLISAIAYSPDGKSLAAAADTYDDTQHVVQVHEIATGAAKAAIRYKAAATGLAFSRDGRYLLTGSDDATARVVDLTSGVQKVFPHSAKVIAVAFAADSRTFVTASEDGVIQLTELPSGKPIPLTGKSSDANAALAFSPQGRYLATGQVLWDLASRTGEPLETRGSLNAIAFTPDDRTIIATSNEGAFVVSTAKRTALATLTNEPARIVGFGSSGDWVAVKALETVKVYRIAAPSTGGTPSDADLEARACALATAADSNELKSFLGAEPTVSCATRR